ncbi:MAG TPA: single-stranded-DNA-specific exonuclease RecJ, partial [Lachnospiraceae bacterium]|nr:single-stranded-DNA-specific exonuclease RecJ [Lachnospiraceae bacterium]
WVVTAKRADFQKIAAHFHIDPVTARILRNRDLTSLEEMERYLNGGLGQLYDGRCMKGMAEALDILEKKLRDGKSIRVIGDYDGDGIMSSYILQDCLERLGGQVDVRIPDRITDGYGINESLVREAHGDGMDTILTCDNGIAAAAQVALAKELGMTVIVTDHHETPYEETEQGRRQLLPPADAVINPHQEGCPYPFKGLCGAGVAYKLAIALGRKMTGEDFTEEYLPFAAIATVTDVMELVDENRIIVKEGLKRLRATENTGLLALIAANGLEPAQIMAYHVGFILGPCLNASGRLYTAKLALKLLTERDQGEAAAIAEELVQLNGSRKAMTEQGVRLAKYQVEATSLKNDRVLVIYLPDCHESIAGIIAGRIREAYYRPVFVLTDSAGGVKGSGRSIEEYSMFEKLVECGGLLDKFGGHPMAAGLSLQKENVEPLRRMLNEKCGLTEEMLTEKVHIDVAMPVSYVYPGLVEEFKLLEPFGRSNPRPVFAQKGLRALKTRIVGKNRNVMRLELMTPEGVKAEGVFFGEVEEFDRWLKGREEFSILYYPQLNTYRGKTSLEIRITGYC